MEKLIINAALTGMVPTKADTPYIPTTPAEIAEDARRCREAGAAIVHLHARDADGIPTWTPARYAEILGAVAEACPDVILCVSTSGRLHKEFAQRSAVLDCQAPKPEMASLTLGSMNFAREPSMNSPEMIRSLAERMKERDIVPECEVFEVGMAEYMRYLADREILTGPFYANILLGSLGTLRATRENLDLCVRALPEGTVWAVAGIGRFQEDASELALSAGGHVRIGLEDNIWYDRERTRKARNAELVERVERRAAELGRDVASPAEARRIIGLPDPLR